MTTKRHDNYFEKVTQFIAGHGPNFELLAVTEGIQSTCDCCGYHPLHWNYLVKGEDGHQFCIGSECQEHVLGILGKPSAEFVRGLSAQLLCQMAARYGEDLKAELDYATDGMNTIAEREECRKDMAKQVLHARYSVAIKRAWDKRRQNKLLAQLSLFPATP